MPVRSLSTRARQSNRTQSNHPQATRNRTNQAHPKRAESDQAHPKRAESDQAHPKRAESDRAHPNRAQSNGAKPNRLQPQRPQQHQVVCADCGVPTTVPFAPTQGRAIYCRSCFNSRRNGATPTAVTPVNEPFAEAETLVEGAPDVDSVFPGMPLKDATRAAIARMKIFSPTPIQEKAIPHLMEGRDLIGQARTGSGKTLAFAVPLTEKCDASVRKVQALVLVPTRELAIQVAGVTGALASAHRLGVTLLYGGRPLRQEYIALRNGPQIIIGTPGRTLDHLRQGTLDLQSVRFMVLDEADEMLDRGFTHDVEAILSKTPSERQTALFSATIPQWVANTAKKHLSQPVRVQLDSEVQAPPSVDHLVYTIQKRDKMDALQTLLDQRDGAPVIVFGKTKHGVKHLANQLVTLGYPVGALQGNLSQAARERVMRDFRSGAASILVATNVAARGLDIEGIGRVINYDLPDSDLMFTHRVGRTGRMGRAGEAVTFITAEEERKWREIERGLGRHFARKSWNTARKAMQTQ